MIEGIIGFIREQKLFRQDENILLAISGGMDSMVMLDLFHRAGFRFGIAHCNFSLRGKESDGDAKFVKSAAKKYKVPFSQKKFKTEQYAKESGLSIQMAARKLRYDWFEEIRSENGYDFIATAHHLDDQIETFFINLIRGTGIAGLHGILPENGRLIRPMLFAFREDVEKYARENHLHYREDSSNQSLKYTRNQIRHQLIPVLQTIQPAFASSITETINKIRNFEMIGQAVVTRNRNLLFQQEDNQIRIEIRQLKKLVPLKAHVYELLSPLGFNSRVIDNLLDALDSGHEKTFFSPTHQLIKDRKNLIITGIRDAGCGMRDAGCGIRDAGCGMRDKNEEFVIEAGVKRIESPVKLKFNIKKLSPDFIIPTTSDVASLDYDRLEFPLTLRKWQAGDAFNPFGMNKKKKLSDFFNDKKFTLTEKENTWILLSNNQIVWVIGQRIDNRFKLTTKTKIIFHVMLLP